MDVLVGIVLIVMVLMVHGLRRRVRELGVTVRALETRLTEISQGVIPATPHAPGEGAHHAPASEALTRSQQDDVAASAPIADEPEPSPAAPEPAPAAPAEGGTTPPTAKPPRSADFERRFGTQWVVWIGGLALALGGIFLVRYSIEAGLFGPGLRVLFGGLLAAGLVGVGEVMRRREILSGIAQNRAAHIPSILTAAGTTVAYADVFAAYALYDFLSPPTAFVLLGAVALATLAAALVHGPALAGLGLVGAYITPALIGGTEPNYWALYIYLAIVTGAAFALARLRLWRWLAITAAAFALLWMLAGLSDPAALNAHTFHVIVGFALASALIVTGFLYGPEPQRGRFDLVSCGILAGYLFGAFLLVMATRHDGLAVITLFVLSAATIVIAWRSEAAMPAIAAAALMALLVIGHWSASDYFVVLHEPGGPFSAVPAVARLEGLQLHLLFGAGIAFLFGAASYLAQGRIAHPYAAIIWAAVGAITPIVTLIALNYGVTQFERSIPFAGLALLLGALFATATEMLSRRAFAPGGAAAAAIYACGAVASLALALTFALERGWLTVALALMVPGIAYVADKRPLPMLRQLCIILTVLVIGRIAMEPRIVGDDVGTTPIFNWLLWGYGVPALAFWYAGILLRKRGDDYASRSVDAAAITFTALTAMLEIRHFMNNGDIYHPSSGLAEAGLQISTGLAMTIGLEHVRARRHSIIHDLGARIIGGLCFIGILASFGIFINPIFTGEPVGGVVFNTILLGYGIPAILMAILARQIHHTRPVLVHRIAALTAIVLALAYLTLEIRRLFHGPVLVLEPTSDAELYTYSAAWLTFGVLLLLGGIALKSQPARFASAAVVIITIGKVFLYDLAGAQGVYRALSFICLGLVLMGIGWLYQRLLFAPRAET